MRNSDTGADLHCAGACLTGFLVTADNCVHVGGLLTFTDLTFPHQQWFILMALQWQGFTESLCNGQFYSTD